MKAYNGHIDAPSTTTHPHSCCATENLKGTTYIWFTEVQAKPNLAMKEGWIWWSKITGHLKTLYRVGDISGCFRSVVRETGNIVTGFRRSGGISWVWEGCRWEKSLCYPTLSPAHGLWTPLWRRKAMDAGEIQSRSWLSGPRPMWSPAICWAIESLLCLLLEGTLDAKGKHMWQSQRRKKWEQSIKGRVSG